MAGVCAQRTDLRQQEGGELGGKQSVQIPSTLGTELSRTRTAIYTLQLLLLRRRGEEKNETRMTASGVGCVCVWGGGGGLKRRKRGAKRYSLQTKVRFKV